MSGFDRRDLISEDFSVSTCTMEMSSVFNYQKYSKNFSPRVFLVLILRMQDLNFLKIVGKLKVNPVYVTF